MGMPLSSLTKNKIQELDAQYQEKRAERERLERTHISDIWSKDLDVINEGLDAEDKYYEEELKEQLKLRKYWCYTKIQDQTSGDAEETDAKRKRW